MNLTTELIIILELLAVLVIVSLISIVLFKDKKHEVNELKDINQALLAQLDQMQTLVDDKNASQDQVVEKFQDLDDELDSQMNATLDNANASLGDMERLILENRAVITDLDYYLNESEPDIKSAKVDIKKLKDLLASTEKEILNQKDQLNHSKTDVKTLKEKMRDLSKKILTMNSLEVSEGRLKRDKSRLMDKMAELKEKYESQKIMARNLEDELKTSFRAGEVQAMKEELKDSEETLKRTMIEKAFIEQHFLELANNSDPDELDRELKRVKREMRQLEQGILDKD